MLVLFSAYFIHILFIHWSFVKSLCPSNSNVATYSKRLTLQEVLRAES